MTTPYSAYMAMMKQAIAMPDPMGAARTFVERDLPGVIRSHLGYQKSETLQHMYGAANEARDTIQSMHRFAGARLVDHATQHVDDAYARVYRAMRQIRNQGFTAPAPELNAGVHRYLQMG